MPSHKSSVKKKDEKNPYRTFFFWKKIVICFLVCNFTRRGGKVIWNIIIFIPLLATSSCPCYKEHQKHFFIHISSTLFFFLLKWDRAKKNLKKSCKEFMKCQGNRSDIFVSEKICIQEIVCLMNFWHLGAFVYNFINCWIFKWKSCDELLRFCCYIEWKSLN